MGRWQVHDCRPRIFSVDDQRVLSEAYRCRCPRCRDTERLLPEGVLPGLTYALETIGSAVATYEEPSTSYRSVALELVGDNRPADFGLPGCGLSTMWGSDKLASPSPSTVFRWVARFSGGATAWWPLIAALTQERLAHALVLPVAPVYLALKARTPTKREQLVTTWALLWVLFLLTSLRREQVHTWPFTMLRAEKRPPRLDPTGWFVGGCRTPP